MEPASHTDPGIEVFDPEESKIDALVLHECDVQVATAQRFPRSIKKCQQAILDLATLDQETAQQMFYEIPRGRGRDRKTISGPSIHFAKIVSLAWQHIRVSGSVVRVEAKRVVCRGICWDLQNNVAWATEVPRTILYSNGERYNPDMITITSLACVSIAQRNALFKVVPEPLWRECYNKARLVAQGDEKTLAARRKDMVAWFGEQKVNADALLILSGARSWEDVGVEQVATLRGIAQAVKDGEIKVEELLADISQTAEKVDFKPTLGDAMKAQKAGGKPKATKGSNAMGEGGNGKGEAQDAPEPPSEA